MQINPYISVIICIYNGGRTLMNAIQSLLELEYTKNRYEIILVNDGSSDNSELICRDIIEIRKDKEPKLTYVFQENSGLGSARNTGIFFSTGGLVAFMDQDASAHKDWLREIKKAFNGDRTIAAVGGKIELLNCMSWFATFSHWIHYYYEDKNGKEVIPLIGTNMAFRKEVFQKVGGFFENFRSCGDETSFINVKVLQYFKQSATPDAIVYHERPWTFREWFKERFSNGHEHALERHISHKYLRSSVLKHYLYFIYRINSLLFLVFMITILFFNSLLISTATIIIVMLFIYRCFLIDNFLIRIKIITKEYGYFRSIWLVPLYFGTVMAGKINDDYGFFKGFFNYKNIHIKVDDGTLGWQEFAPFNKIVVTASSLSIPGPLLDQLSKGGKMVMPVGSRFTQRLILLEKSEQGRVSEKDICGCVFVPLIGRYGWEDTGAGKDS